MAEDDIARKEKYVTPAGDGNYFRRNSYRNQGRPRQPGAQSSYRSRNDGNSMVQRDAEDIGQQRKQRFDDNRPTEVHHASRDTNKESPRAARGAEGTQGGQDGLRASEQAGWHRPDNLEKSEHAPAGGFYKPSQNTHKKKDRKEHKSEGKTDGNNVRNFLSRRKKGLAGILAGVVMTGGLMVGGTLMAGVAQFLQAAELIGNITDTIHDAVVGARTMRNIARAKTVGVKMAEGRVSILSKYMARSYEKKLAKAGIEIISDGITGEFKEITVKPNSGGFRNMDKFIENGKVNGHPNIPDGTTIKLEGGKWRLTFPDGATRGGKASWFKKLFRSIRKVIPDAPAAGAVMTRILGKKNLMLGFHPFQRLEAKIVGNIAERMEKYVVKKLTKKYAKQGIKKTTAKIAEEAAQAVAKNFVKKIPVIGWIITAVDFGVTLYGKHAVTIAMISMTLGVSMAKAMEIQSMADQIRSGEFTTKAENGDHVDPMEQLELASAQNFYREVETIELTEKMGEGFEKDAEGAKSISVPNDGDECADDDTGCMDRKKAESEYDSAYKNIRETMNSGVASGAVGDSFWSSSLVKYEMEGTYSGDETTIPSKLLYIHKGSDKSAEKWGGDIANSALEAVVGISPDMFSADEDFVAENLLPSQIGSTSMYGSKVAANEKMRAIGGTVLSGREQIAVENERRETIAQEFNQRQWHEKLFDINSYQSGIATLAHSSGWNLNDPSIFNQLKNVAKTFAMVPQLFSKTINRVASAANDGGGAEFDYNVGELGITNEAIDDLPNYDEAEAAVMKELNDKNRKIYIKQAGLTIEVDGRVVPSANTPKEESANPYEEQNATYNYQVEQGDTDPTLTETLDYVDEDGTVRQVPNAVQAYVLDYQIAFGSSITDQGSAESDIVYDEMLDEDGISRDTIEGYINDGYNDMVRLEDDGLNASGSDDGGGSDGDSDDNGSDGSSNSAAADLGINKGLAQQIIDSNATYDPGVKDEFEYIAKNGRSKTSTINNNLMRFIAESVRVLSDGGMQAKLNALADTHEKDGGNHPKGLAVDVDEVSCNSKGSASEVCKTAQAIYEEVGKKYGIKPYSAEKLTNSNHGHFSTTGF